MSGFRIGRSEMETDFTVLVFFKSGLLRYNLHTVKFILHVYIVL
jgi:hypothetical protein